MLYKVLGEQPFQVLSNSFSISPSESGYNLYLSADGINYSPFITVASGVTKQMVDMNEGNYYRLMGNTSTVTVNWMKECGGGGGGTAGVSSLDGQTGALTLKTINGNSILGSGNIPISGGSGSSVSYQETLTGGTEIGRITIDGSTTTIYAPTPETYNLPIAGANTLGGVKVGSGLTIDNNGVLSASGETYELPIAGANTLGGVKVGSGLAIDNNGVLSASGETYELPIAGANTLGGVKVGSGLTIDSGGVLSVSGGTQGGRTVINLDTLSQAEKAALFEEISGLTSNSQAVNDKYVFIKSFNSQHSGNQTPYAVEYTKYENSKMWFLGFNWGGQSGEIWVLKYSLKTDGTDEASMAPNYSFNNLSRLLIFRNREWVKYDFTTSAFSTPSASDTMFTGDTCSGAWVTDFDTNTFTNAGVPEFKFKVTDDTFNERLFTNPIVSYETLATPVTLEDTQGTSRPFPYIWYLDYGYCIVSMYVDLEQQRYARLSIQKRSNS